MYSYYLQICVRFYSNLINRQNTSRIQLSVERIENYGIDDVLEPIKTVFIGFIMLFISGT